MSHVRFRVSVRRSSRVLSEESAAGESAFVGGNGVEVVAFFVEFTFEVVVSHDVPFVALGEEYLLAYFLAALRPATGFGG